ncbi:hypothetical protein K402DRAFT_249855 [Aulographum hederae CBS 113979]|uniref:Uncharacterized protein n=1 Tax=Aulographum hederae CBS 113979 TaxID=1176131 RepID=A0A6G1GJX1_9PEZI|nr:hypothetical protein K402DRAFT_249855 [Aulographum hederae CBS 113979]
MRHSSTLAPWTLSLPHSQTDAPLMLPLQIIALLLLGHHPEGHTWVMGQMDGAEQMLMGEMGDGRWAMGGRGLLPHLRSSCALARRAWWQRVVAPSAPLPSLCPILCHKEGVDFVFFLLLTTVINARRSWEADRDHPPQKTDLPYFYSCSSTTSGRVLKQRCAGLLDLSLKRPPDLLPTPCR